MKKRHLICNAHIDPIWQWDWPEGVSAVISTFASAVRLADKYDYIFCHNEVTVYKYVEEYAPELFEKIKELVKQGKWHIMGGWYLQPDCNMPSGESFVRQIREGERYFREKFGTFPTTAINFDPFGHTAGLVQIIKKCGQDGYLFMRPQNNLLSLPDEHFIWRGLDGSEIKAARTGTYSSPLGRSAAEIRRRAEADGHETGLVLWGVGNHGGGPSDKDLSDIATELLPSDEIEYIHSTPERFFEEVTPSAVYEGSLRISMPGCYTSMYRVKKLHAKLEHELATAESAAAVAYATGALADYPEEQLRVATQDLLNAEFHDVLPGSSVQCGEEAGLRFLDHGILEAERVKVKAYFALAASEKCAAEGEYPILVYNPHAHEVCDNIECEFMLADQNWNDELVSAITLKDKDGNIIPHQVIKEESNLNLDWRKRIIFEAKLPPLSLTRYSVYVDYAPRSAEAARDSFVFDNERKHVSVSKETGLLESYRIDGVEYIGEGFGLVSFEDNADPWGMSNAQARRLGENERPFTLSAIPTGVFAGMRSVGVIEDGEIYLGIEAFFEQDNTRARILYKIYKNNDAVDIDVTLYLCDINRIVKLKLPIAVDGTLIGQTAFGTEELYTDGRENTAQRFVALDNGGTCLALMNNGVYGGHFENSALYTSLVRGVTYCAHPIKSRPLIPEDKFTKKIDQGESSYSFRLTVTPRDTLERRTREFTLKPFSQNIFPVGSGELRLERLDVALGDESTCVETVKRADGRDAIIFRILNNTPSSRETYIAVNGKRLALSFGKYEVKTVIFEGGELSESYELII